jgi:hypothetical protein
VSPHPGSTGAAPAAKPADQTELERLESLRQAERRAARLGLSLKKPNSGTACIPLPLDETVETGIVAALTAKQQQEPAPMAVPEAAVPATHIVGDPTWGGWPGGYDGQTKRPRKGILNTIEAIKRAGITCTWDEFRQKQSWFGHPDKSFDGEVSDAAVTVTRRNICKKFLLYPDITETRDAITDACHDNKSNPVLDYFARIKWDGKARLDKMLHNYLGADDTTLNAAIGRKTMCAIVRRAKRPGCKFDNQLVLQADQGVRKSTFCEDLAVFPDLFTDAGDLSAEIKQQLEIGQGKQIIEFPEHAGFSRAARDRNKASLSRKVDRARMAYAHYATDTPRQWVPIATVNPGGYLNDPTGERRSWHVAMTGYVREAFLADKDQLYAEAVVREPNENLWLDTPDLVKAHDAIVASAKEPNELVDLLRDLRGEVWHINGKDEERVSAQDIRFALGMMPADAAKSHGVGRRILEAMMALGWTKASGTIRCRKGDQPMTGYTRPLPPGSGSTKATGVTGAACGRGNTGPGPTGPTGGAGASDVTGAITLDQRLALEAAKAQADFARRLISHPSEADLALIRRNS